MEARSPGSCSEVSELSIHGILEQVCSLKFAHNPALMCTNLQAGRKANSCCSLGRLPESGTDLCGKHLSSKQGAAQSISLPT